MTKPRQAPIDGLLEKAFVARTERGTRKAARIAVLGEFNSGKTTLVNAMLGADVFPAGIVTRTDLPAVAQYASRPSLSMKMADGTRVPLAIENLGQPPPAGARELNYRLPLESLKRVSIVDTPAADMEGAAIDPRIVQACRGADLLVWCTPAMQAWKYSEQLLWLMLPTALRKRGVLAVTFADQVTSESDLDRLLIRLHADAGPYFTDIVIPANALLPAGQSARSRGRKLREKAPQH